MRPARRKKPRPPVDAFHDGMLARGVEMADEKLAKEEIKGAVGAMPDGSTKSDFVPTDAMPTTPAEPAEETPTESQAVIGKPEEKVKDEVEIQLDLLKDKDWFRRKDAAITLGEMGDERAIPALITALRDSEWNVREAAQGSLAQIGSAAVEPLIEATKDEDWSVRIAAIAGLDSIGDERGKPAIKALVKDTDFAVQMRAERIIWAWKKKAKEEAGDETEETAGTA